ncbi:hypothetical protein [Cellulomonas endophytica]|uniref:hypothetical protein n=1 Tax=Cellulomonas endophytica TaxID=2494735 RepID=UPI001011AEE0|nr:hypothetical protein [Cellulomonas endophytica]
MDAGAVTVRFAVPPPADALLPRLGPADRERVAAHRPGPVRDALAASLVLADAVVHGATDGRGRLVRRCPRCGSGRHGAPRVVGGPPGRPAPLVSLARTPGLVVVALGRAAGGRASGPGDGPGDGLGDGLADGPADGLGVDVESGAVPADALRAAGVRAAPGGGADDRRTRWVRAEAVLKAAGCGLRLASGALDVADAAGAPAVRTADPRLAGGRWWLLDLVVPAGAPPGAAAALALRTTRRGADAAAGPPGAGRVDSGLVDLLGDPAPTVPHGA